MGKCTTFIIALLCSALLFMLRRMLPNRLTDIAILEQESPERYRREMHYLESLVFHVAYREGTVSLERIFELVPGLANCADCRRHLRLIFEFGVLKRELIVDVKTGRAMITNHVRRLVRHADLFEDFGTAWVLPERKIRFLHRACHVLPVC